MVRRWIGAVLAHRPGSLDEPLKAVATAPPGNFETVARGLRAVLRWDYPTPGPRNDVRRRGALLHTDLALLLPNAAADFRQFSDGRVLYRADAVVVSEDGRFLDRDAGNCHWQFASWLLAGIAPDPAADEFVRLWYRAVAATFQADRRFGNSEHHLRRAKELLPRDPVLLFYDGALHEALASPRFQNVPISAPAMGREIGLVTEDEQLQEAQRLLRRAIDFGAPPEARLRLGRVLGRLGKHAEAVELLDGAVVPAGDARLSYFRELLLGTELAALGRLDEAVPHLERAAAQFPTAQAPLVAMSAVQRRAGNRVAAIEALRRLQALPEKPSMRNDPWWAYHRSYAADAGDQLAAVRAWVDREAPR
jgi:tetratricopeptide (TPR) repeat protein